MPAYRYWGLDLRTEVTFSGTFFLALAEVEMRATVGGADLCTGGTPGAASFDPGFPPSNLYDNNFTTYLMRSGNTSLRVWYDFGAPVDVGEVWFRLPNSGVSHPGSTHGPQGVQVIGSDDGVSWRPLATYILPSRADGGEHAVEVPTSYEYLLAGETLTLSVSVTNVPMLTGAALFYDAADGGPYRVAGTVVIDGTPATPASRRVRLFDKVSGRLVREQWSAADGTFEFAQVSVGPWLLVVDDYTLTYEADAATEVLAVL